MCRHLIAVLLVGALVLAGCGSSPDPRPADRAPGPVDLAGTWTAEGGRADLHFRAVRPDPAHPDRDLELFVDAGGRLFRVDGPNSFGLSEFWVETADGELTLEEARPCGTFAYEIAGNRLTLSSSNPACAARRVLGRVLSGEWTRRQPTPAVPEELAGTWSATLAAHEGRPVWRLEFEDDEGKARMLLDQDGTETLVRPVEMSEGRIGLGACTYGFVVRDDQLSLAPVDPACPDSGPYAVLRDGLWQRTQ